MIAGNLSSTNSASFSANGSGSITSANGALIDAGAGSLQLMSGSGDIGSSANALLFNAASISAKTGGTGNVSLSGSTGGTSLDTSSAGGSFTLLANGNIVVSGNVTAPTVNLQTELNSNGSIIINGAVGQSQGTVNLSTDGSGSISGAGTILGSSENFSSITGHIGSAGQALNTSASTLLTVNTGGSVTIANTVPAGSNSVDVGASAVGASLNLTSNSTINLDGPISASGVTITAIAGSSGSININGDLTGTAGSTVSLAADQGGLINQTAGTLNCGLLQVSSGSGGVNLGIGSAVLSSSGLSINTTGSANVQDNAALTISNTSVSGNFSIVDEVSISTSDNLTIGSGSITAPIFTNDFALNVISGSLQIQSQIGSNLTFLGSGNITASAVTLTAGGGSLEIGGTPSIVSPSVLINASDSLQVDGGSNFNITGNLTANTAMIFNSNAFTVSGSNLMNVPSGKSFGTIANSQGNVVLTSKLLVNTFGKNLLIIASGDVLSSGLATLNLSSSTGFGGSLVVLAGVNFSPATGTPAAQTLDIGSTFSVSGSSSTGGSINLSGTTINTSSNSKLAGSTQGGNVTLVATAVSGASAGVVLTGAISTNSSFGQGGSLKIIAPGGVQVNGAITTKGSSVSGAVTIAASPYTHGTIQALDGYLTPSSNLRPSSPVNGSAAGVRINSGINTVSATGLGGAVTLSADSQIIVNGSIETSGQKNGGAITLSSLEGTLTVGGEINSSGLTGTAASAPGSGASISISVPEFATIKGSLRTNGGNAIRVGQNGGTGGTVSLNTSIQDDPAQKFLTGKIVVKGYVNTSGGSAVSTAGGGKGGAGGSVTINAGSMQITGAIGTASILASGAKGALGTGINGAVLLSTYAVQAIPSNFNLLSSVASEFALPGGLFNADGGSSVVNGTAANIVSGASVVTKSNGGLLTAGALKLGGIQVTVGGGSQNILVNGTNTAIAPAIGSVRVKITPAEAVALYQVSLGNSLSQTLGLSSPLKTAGSINPQGGTSVISIPSYDLPVAFSSFVLQAQGNANGIQLSISGFSPVLNLPASTISGQINFSNSNLAVINTGATPFNLLAGSSVTANNSLALISGSISNAGTINSSVLDFLRTNAAVTFTNKGVLNTGSIAVSATFAPSSLSIINAPGFVFNAPILFSPLPLATGFASLIPAMTPGAIGTSTTSLQLNIPSSTATIGGATNGISNLNITTLSTVINKVSTPTNLSIQTGSNLTVGTSIHMSSAGTMSLGSSGATLTVLKAGSGLIALSGHSSISTVSASLTAKGAIKLSSTAGQLVDTGSSYNSTLSTVTLSALGISQDSTTSVTAKTGISLIGTATGASGAISLGASYTDINGNGSIRVTTPGAIVVNATTLTAGILSSSGLANAGQLAIVDLSFKGSIILTSGNTSSSPGSINFSGVSPAHLQANGGNVTLTANGVGQIDLGTGNVFGANGGNLVILTGGSVSGQSGDQFSARSVGPAKTSVGGGIEIGAGTTISQLPAALALTKLPATPSIITGHPTINNIGSSNGVVIVNGPSSNVTLNTSIINLDQGAVVFDAKNSQTIQLDGATFSVEAFKPIAFNSVLSPENNADSASDDGAEDYQRAESIELANILASGLKKSTLLKTAAGKRDAVHFEISLHTGEIFLNPLRDIVIKTSIGSIQCKRNSIVTVAVEKDCLRVAACSGPGDITVRLRDKSIQLTAGEEIVITDQQSANADSLRADALFRPDGIGRRNFRTYTLGNGSKATISEISIFSMMSNYAHLLPLLHPSNKAEKALSQRLLRTSAALGLVTNSHGPYQSNKRKTNSNSGSLLPVRYVESL